MSWNAATEQYEKEKKIECFFSSFSKLCILVRFVCFNQNRFRTDVLNSNSHRVHWVIKNKTLGYP